MWNRTSSGTSRMGWRMARACWWYNAISSRWFVRYAIFWSRSERIEGAKRVMSKSSSRSVAVGGSFDKSSSDTRDGRGPSDGNFSYVG